MKTTNPHFYSQRLFTPSLLQKAGQVPGEVTENQPPFRAGAKLIFNKFVFCSALIFCFALCNLQFVNSQNLVPNWSFEDTVACPNGNWFYVNDWTSFRSSPDYFNSCSLYHSVPQTGFGYQQAATGNAFAGFFSHSNGEILPNYREYIGSELLQSLIIGTKYYISIKFNKSNNPYAQCATNKLGILFSTVAFNDSDTTTIRNFAHLFSISIIMDTLNWTTIQGSFIADSAYQYIIIGNFFDDNNTDSILLSSTACNAYYFVDDICVSTDSLTCVSTNSVYEINSTEHEISIFPNPANNIIHFNTLSYFKCNIYNALGTLYKVEYNQSQLDVSSFPVGFYIFQIKYNNKTTNRKIIINH